MTALLVVFAILLILESLWTAFWIAGLVPSVARHDAGVIAIVIARGLVGGMQLAAGVFLIGRRAVAVPLARVTLVVSAALTTLEVGWRLAPTSLDRGLAWPIVLAYWTYALAWSAALRRRQRARTLCHRLDD
jgi:hypothetical protein